MAAAAVVLSTAGVRDGEETRIFYPSLSSPKSLDGARFVRVTPCRRAVPRRILSRCRVAHAVLGGRAQAGVPVAGGGRAVARAAAKPCGVPRSLVCGKWRESWSRASEGVHTGGPRHGLMRLIIFMVIIDV